MTFCSVCGSEIDENETFCSNCGTRIEVYQLIKDRDQIPTHKKSTMAKNVFIKTIINLNVFFLLDIIGLALILEVIQKFTLYSNLVLVPTSPFYLILTMIVGSVISILQTVTFERSFLPLLKDRYKYNSVIYFIIPVVHLLVLLPFFIISSNYFSLNYALGSLIILEVAIGALHIYYRYTKLSNNYNIINKEITTDQQKKLNKEKFEFEKKTLEAEKEAMINYIQYIQHKG